MKSEKPPLALQTAGRLELQSATLLLIAADWETKSLVTL